MSKEASHNNSLSRFFIRGVQDVALRVLSSSRLHIECIRAVSALAQQVDADDIEQTEFLQ